MKTSINIVTMSQVLTYLNSYHSLAGSDFTDNKIAVKAMEYCEKRVFMLTGMYLHSLPTDMEKLLEFLESPYSGIKRVR